MRTFFIGGFLFCTLSFSVSNFAAAQTNLPDSIIAWDSFEEELFLTDNEQGIVIDPVSKQQGFYASALQTARKSAENQPATKDPKGNWGVANAGFQISLRFSNESYTNNQPITTIVILRNVSAETLRWTRDWNVEKLWFVIDGPDGRQTTPRSSAPILVTSGPTWLTVRQKTQRRFEFDLRHKFDLQSPGKYLIQIQMEVLGTNTSNLSVVSSGQATVEIGNSIKSLPVRQK